MGDKKLIWGILLAISVRFAEGVDLATEHFRVYEILHGEKVVVEHGDFASPELECAVFYQSNVHEMSQNELLFSSVIGHGTGFNIEKLFIIRAEEAGLRIYSISDEEILKQLRKRTKFETLKII